MDFSEKHLSPAQPVNPNGPFQDFGCYITIQNDSDEDLYLDDSGITDGYGEWPLGQPINIIRAGASETVNLKDKTGPAGSEGWVQYEVDVGDNTETFRVSFDCPTRFWQSNKVKWDASSDAISLKVGWYESTGHPLRCTVTFSLASRGADSTESVPSLPTAPEHPSAHVRCADTGLTPGAESSDETARVNYEFGFEPPAWLKPIHKWTRTAPIHESIAIAAFIQIKDKRLRMARATTVHNLSPDQWEFFRGLLWPDDPRCLIFNDKVGDNRSFGIGLEWLREFQFGEPWTMTRRSHFGDLQFLHAMGSEIGERPEDTRDKLIQFMGVMYRLATGQDGVAEADSVTKHFPGSVFGPSWDHTSLRQLLLATTPSYAHAEVGKRALGVCLHMIQDSYAVGHVKRELLNPEDEVRRGGDGYIQFKEGTHGRWGDVMCFHTYTGQNGWRHKHYDGVPDWAKDPSPRTLTTFDPIIGARFAIDGCLSLIQSFVANKPWAEVKEELENGIFKLHPDAQPSDVNVDMISSEAYGEKEDADDVEYWAGHERKLEALDVPGKSLHQRRRWSGRISWPRRTVSLGFVSVFMLACILTLVMTMVGRSRVLGL